MTIEIYTGGKRRRSSKGKRNSRRRGRSAKSARSSSRSRSRRQSKSNRNRKRNRRRKSRSASKRGKSRSSRRSSSSSRSKTYTGQKLAQMGLPSKSRVGKSNLERFAPKMTKHNVKLPGMNRSIGAEARAMMNLMKNCPQELVNNSTSYASAFAKCLSNSRK